jgi:hypothetical protein
VAPLIAEWFERYVVAGDLRLQEATPEAGVTYLDRTAKQAS